MRRERLKNVKKLGDIMTPKAKFNSLLSSACLLFSENFSQKFLTKQVCIEVWQEGVCTYENVGTGTQLDRASIVLKADPKIVLRALEILLMGVEKRLLSRVHSKLDFKILVQLWPVCYCRYLYYQYVLRALEILLMGVEKRLLSRVHIRLDFKNYILFFVDILRWQYFYLLIWVRRL